MLDVREVNIYKVIPSGWGKVGDHRLGSVAVRIDKAKAARLSGHHVLQEVGFAGAGLSDHIEVPRFRGSVEYQRKGAGDVVSYTKVHGHTEPRVVPVRGLPS